MNKPATMKYIAPLLLLLTGYCSCSNKEKETAVHPAVRDSIAAVGRDTNAKDSIVVKETFNEEDQQGNEYMLERLKPIRENFKRINSISDWTQIKEKELWESTEGGVAKFYYLGNKPQKIVTKNFGETYQLLSEYYLKDNELSFVFEKEYRYNRPIYYDSAAMKANNDTTVFDIDQSSYIETRSYFDKGKLLHQLNNQDCGSPFNDEYLGEEQKRIMAIFKRLRKL